MAEVALVVLVLQEGPGAKDVAENAHHHYLAQSVLPLFLVHPELPKAPLSRQGLCWCQGTLSHQTQHCLRASPFEFLGSRRASLCSWQNIQ